MIEYLVTPSMEGVANPQRAFARWELGPAINVALNYSKERGAAFVVAVYDDGKIRKPVGYRSYRDGRLQQISGEGFD
jgi:hypothetical protein